MGKQKDPNYDRRQVLGELLQMAVGNYLKKETDNKVEYYLVVGWIWEDKFQSPNFVVSDKNSEVFFIPTEPKAFYRSGYQVVLAKDFHPEEDNDTEDL